MKPAKKGRGGVRRGAGRKQVLTLKQIIIIGAMCDQIQTKEREKLAFARHAKSPRIAATSRAQQLVQKRRPSTKGEITLIHRLAEEGLSKSELRKPATGFFTLPLPRGRSRLAICNQVSDTCIGRLKMLRITPRRVEAAWKDFRALESRLKADLAKRRSKGAV